LAQKSVKYPRHTAHDSKWLWSQCNQSFQHLLMACLFLLRYGEHESGLQKQLPLHAPIKNRGCSWSTHWELSHLLPNECRMMKHWKGYWVYNSQVKFKEEEGVQEFVHHASMMEQTGTDSSCGWMWLVVGFRIQSWNRAT